MKIMKTICMKCQILFSAKNKKNNLSFPELAQRVVIVKGKINNVVYHITKTCLCNFDPLKPHFYVVKLGFTLFFLFLLKT